MIKTGKDKDIHENMKILITELSNIISSLEKIDKIIPLGAKEKKEK